MKKAILLLCFFSLFKAQAHLAYTKVITGRKGAESIYITSAFTKYLPDGSVFNLGTFIGCNKQSGIYLSKMDTKGNLKRTTFYTSPGIKLTVSNESSGFWDSQNSACIYTSDHCFVLIFDLQQTLGKGIIKIDTSGKVIFNEQFTSKNFIELLTLAEDHSHNLLLNFLNAKDYKNSSILAKVSSSGQTLWIKNYIMPHQYYFNTCVLGSDNGFLLSYRLYTSMHATGFTRIDSDGNVIWSKEIAISINPPEYHSSLALPDNTFVLMGRLEDTAKHSKRKLLLTKIAGDGTLLSSKCYDSIYTSYLNPSCGNLLYLNKNEYAIIDENDQNSFIRPFIMTVDSSLNENAGYYYNYGHYFCQTDFDPAGDQYSLVGDMSNYMYFYMTESSLETSCPGNPIKEKGRDVTFKINDGTVNVTPGALTLDSIKIKTEDIIELLAEYSLCPNTSPVYKSVFPTSVVLCKGRSYRLKAPDRSNISHFFWSTGDTTSYTDISRPGKYWVQFGMLGCVLTDTITAKYRPDIKRVSTTHHRYKCPSDTIILSAYSDSVSIAWITPDNGMFYGNTVQAVDSGIYRIVIANAVGCIDIDTVFVHSYPLPNAYAGLDTIICYGSSFTLEGSGGIKYTWHPADYLDNPNVADPRATPPKTQKYILFVTNSEGCTSTDTMWLNVRPPLAIKTSAHKPELCEGDSLNIKTDYAGGLSKNYSFRWMDSTGNLIDTLPELHIKPKAPGFYVVSLSDGCSRIATDTVQLIVHPVPEVFFSAIDTAGCAPFALSFTNKDTANDVLYWTFGDGTHSSERSPVHVFQKEGLYDISLVITNTSGCSRSLTRKAYITVHPQVKASFTANPYKTTINKPDISFRNNSTGASKYNWNFGDGSQASNLFEPDHKYADTGIYSIRLIAYNTFGCTDTFSRRVVVQDLFRSHIPNSFTPNGDGVNDVFAPVFTGASSYSMTIYNRWGQLLYDNNSTSKGWDGRFNGAYAIEGVYLYMITATGIDGSRYYYHGNVTLLR